MGNNELKIVSWNCKYGLSKEKAATFLEAFHDAEIYVIQECKRMDVDIFKNDWKSKNWYGDDLDEKSELGIAIFSKTWKIEFTNEFNRNFRYVVPFRISKNNKSFVLFAVWTKSHKYGPYNYDENVTKALNTPEYKKLYDEGAIIIGDFNTASNDTDNTHIKYYENLVSGLNNFYDCANETEIHKTTFRDWRGLFRNDFCFITNEFPGKIINYKVHDDWEDKEGQKCYPYLSDHCPISVVFEF